MSLLPYTPRAILLFRLDWDQEKQMTRLEGNEFLLLPKKTAMKTTKRLPNTVFKSASILIRLNQQYFFLPIRKFRINRKLTEARG